MKAVTTGADLRAIAPDHTVFSDKALAEALHVSPHQIPELRRQADVLFHGSDHPTAAALMRTCGINAHEAESYLALSAGGAGA